MKNSLLVLLLISVFVSAQSQVEIDTHPSDSSVVTDRYIDYSDQLLLKIMSVVKTNNLSLVNTQSNQTLKLSPFGITSLGFGFNYKWLGLGIAFGLPETAEQKKIYGKTKRFDFQLNIYSKKFVIDAFMQQYSGFYVTNPSDFTTWDSIPFPQRDSMKTISMGINGYYILNNKKLSFKAAYVRNAIQKKSAGSILVGGFVNLDYAGFEDGASSHFVPNYFPIDVQDSFPINSYLAKSYGISVGYTYTFVFLKHFFINLTFVPGVGAKDLEVYKSTGKKIHELKGAARVIYRGALGYENKYFLIGFTTYSSIGTFQFENYQIKPSTTGARFFIAKRFNLKKKKKVPSE